MRLWLRKGVTRWVVVTRRYAIKVPNLSHGMWGFCQGVLANHSEREWSGWPGVNPQLRSWLCGTIAVYRRCQPYTADVEPPYDDPVVADHRSRSARLGRQVVQPRTARWAARLARLRLPLSAHIFTLHNFATVRLHKGPKMTVDLREHTITDPLAAILDVELQRWFNLRVDLTGGLDPETVIERKFIAEQIAARVRAVAPIDDLVPTPAAGQEWHSNSFDPSNDDGRIEVVGTIDHPVHGLIVVSELVHAPGYQAQHVVPFLASRTFRRAI